MPRRKALPVLIGDRPNRIYVDDLKHIHHRIKKPRPMVPKYNYKIDEESSTDEHEIAGSVECRVECKAHAGPS